MFDSGVGGLTVLHELLVALPHEDFVYLGDTARFPYGERSAEELERFSLEIAERLVEGGPSSWWWPATPRPPPRCPRSRPTSRSARSRSTSWAWSAPESVLAVAATATAASGCSPRRRPVAAGAYDRAIQSADPLVGSTSVPCPDLAPIVQGGFPFDQRVVDTVRAYCEPLREADVDTVILGCTHYPLVAPMLQRALGRGVTLDPLGTRPSRAGSSTRSRGRGLENPRDGEGDYRFLCTGDVEAFRTLGTRFLQLPMGDIDHVELGAQGARCDAARRARPRRAARRDDRARLRAAPRPGRRSSRPARRA